MERTKYFLNGFFLVRIQGFQGISKDLKGLQGIYILRGADSMAARLGRHANAWAPTRKPGRAPYEDTIERVNWSHLVYSSCIYRIIIECNII